MELNHEQRRNLSNKLGELGNIVAGALIFGQFLSERRFNFINLTAGFILSLMAYYFSNFFLKNINQ